MFLKIFLNKIIKEINLFLPVLASSEDIEKVYNFFISYPDFRLLTNCSQETGLSVLKCSRIKKYLYKKRRLGLYFFAPNTPPQKYMKEYILNNFKNISNNSNILEVGPGEYPIFDFNHYKKWYAIDKFFLNNTIKFKSQAWAKNKYPLERIRNGAFENLSLSVASDLVGSFDLVVGSHSYEHVLRPIKSLREINKVLRPGGILVLFVPDGFSNDINAQDPTHTLYINKDMMLEFFAAAGGFRDIIITTFRPNADLVITAIKI